MRKITTTTQLHNTLTIMNLITRKHQPIHTPKSTRHFRTIYIYICETDSDVNAYTVYTRMCDTVLVCKRWIESFWCELSEMVKEHDRKKKERSNHTLSQLILKSAAVVVVLLAYIRVCYVCVMCIFFAKKKTHTNEWMYAQWALLHLQAKRLSPHKQKSSDQN